MSKAQAAGAVVKEGLATIHKIETSYPARKLRSSTLSVLIHLFRAPGSSVLTLKVLMQAIF